jgi:hypothetical protein
MRSGCTSHAEPVSQQIAGQPADRRSDQQVAFASSSSSRSTAACISPDAPLPPPPSGWRLLFRDAQHPPDLQAPRRADCPALDPVGHAFQHRPGAEVGSRLTVPDTGRARRRGAGGVRGGETCLGSRLMGRRVPGAHADAADRPRRLTILVAAARRRPRALTRTCPSTTPSPRTASARLASSLLRSIAHDLAAPRPPCPAARTSTLVSIGRSYAGDGSNWKKADRGSYCFGLLLTRRGG